MYTARKTMTRTVLFLVLIVVTPPSYSQGLKNSIRTQPALVEEFSFSLKDFRMEHQGQENNLHIAVSFRYVSHIVKPDYPDFRWLAKDIETLLASYPNEVDYWQIVNKQITALLLQKIPGWRRSPVR